MININGKEWNALESHDVKMLVESDVDESFFFEFKSDQTNNAKIVKEVSAFANTFGGYIFIGVSDDKKIEGCIQWNEQRRQYHCCR